MGSLRPFAVPIGPIIFHVVPKPRIVSKGSGARCSSRDERGNGPFSMGRAPEHRAQARFPGRNAALPSPLTQRRRSNARRRHPRLRRRELEAARATARCRLDQVRHRHRTPTSALQTPARRRPSDRHSPRVCRAAAAASARAAAAALYTFALIDEPEGLQSARSRPAPPARQPADSHARAFRRGAATVHSESS